MEMKPPYGTFCIFFFISLCNTKFSDGFHLKFGIIQCDAKTVFSIDDYKNLFVKTH
jgi:hypothetical protein